MERVGEKLRRRREELGFTIDDIARATKYRPDVITAIEEGRTGVFPAEAYRLAFLRAYAYKLGLDPAEIVREQKSEEERVQEALKGIRLKPRTGPGVRRTLVWLVIIVVVAAGLLVLYDRVIKVRGLGQPVDEAESPHVGAAESTLAGSPDSQAVTAPMDSVGRDRAMEKGEGPEDEGPGESEASEETGAVESRGGEEVAVVTEPVPDMVEDEAVADETVVEVDEPAQAPEAALAPVAGPGGPADRDWLAVSVRGYAVRARLRAGDSLLVDRWLRSGFRDTFYSNQPFWADTIIASENSMLLVLNGERVDLPSAGGGVITDFRISP